MITDRHKAHIVIGILSWLCLWAGAPSTANLAEGVFEVFPATTPSTTTEPKSALPPGQDEVNGLSVIPAATTAQTVQPRVDYNNQWRPLGHGDPLQKDPTYDYSPPALERVRYWAENNGSSKSTEAKKKELPPEVLRNKTKNEILLLGVSSERARLPQAKTHSPVHHYSAKYPAIRRSYYAPQQQHMPPTHLMPPPMAAHTAPVPAPGQMKHMDFRHNSYMSSPATAHLKSHYYSSPVGSTSPWLHSSVSMGPMRMAYPADAHHQESMQHYSFSRPAMQSAGFSPNAIHGHPNALKPAAMGAPQRKPWLHELLQKELVKSSPKPTMPATKYLMNTQPHRLLPTLSSTYAPVTFVPGPPTIVVPTMPTTTTRGDSGQVYITPTPYAQATTAGFRPMISSEATTVAATTALPVFRSTSSTRLLIPQTSNLAQRPTVAPAADMTTDALFSHYKQPEKPLLGPMYLIIEGHSKVKTYGQNELDPHSPKIVPIISKREPVVRIADPNEKRGTVETFQVKHLHTKTTPLGPTTTTTTVSPPTTTKKPPIMKPTPPMAPIPTLRPANASTGPSESGVSDLLSLLDNMFADAHAMASSTAKGEKIYVTSTMSTILRPVTTSSTKLSQQPEPRIGTKAGTILSLLDDEDGSVEVATSTELPPPELRQIFDYDQLPESRLKAESVTATDLAYDDEDDIEDDETETETETETSSLEEDNETDGEHNLLKRIDKFVDDVDDGDDDLDDLIEGFAENQGAEDDEEEDLVRRH